MRTYKTVKVEKEVVSTTICNKCGDWISTGDFPETPHFHNIAVFFGYPSEFDGETWDFEVCESCLIGIIREFRYVPSGFRNLYGMVEDEGHEHQQLFDEWKYTNNWEVLKFKSYDDIVSLKGYYRTEVLNNYIKKYHPDQPLL